MNPKVLILSGPTHEYIDPVRFIGNASSGLLGKAIAEEAAAEGYEVSFVTGPISDDHIPELGKHGTVKRVVSAAEMLEAASAIIPEMDAVIFAAAVADYTPVEKITEKMAKSDNDLTLHLKATADIAKTLCADKKPHQIAIGFALQTKDAEKNARNKLIKKNLDGIVLNSPATLGANTGTFSFLSADTDQFEPWGCISKEACAVHIFDKIKSLSRGKLQTSVRHS